MTQYLESKNIVPDGTYYTFTQTEINNLIIDFVKEKTGFTLNLSVGCLDEDFDVYVAWGDETDELMAAFESFEAKQDDAYEPLCLNPEEEFMNRDYLFQRIFGSEAIGYNYNDELNEPVYTLFVHTAPDKDN